MEKATGEKPHVQIQVHESRTRRLKRAGSIEEERKADVRSEKSVRVRFEDDHVRLLVSELVSQLRNSGHLRRFLRYFMLRSSNSYLRSTALSIAFLLFQYDFQFSITSISTFCADNISKVCILLIYLENYEYQESKGRR